MTAVAASAIALAWAIVGPTSPMDVPARPSVVRGAGTIASLRRRDTSSDALLERAMQRDPFTSVQRVDAEPAASTPRTVATDQPLRVLGTVVDSSGGSFALCQLGATQAIILRVGQRIGDYELRRVDKGRAVFATFGGEIVELRVLRAGA